MHPMQLMLVSSTKNRTNIIMSTWVRELLNALMEATDTTPWQNGDGWILFRNILR